MYFGEGLLSAKGHAKLPAKGLLPVHAMGNFVLEARPRKVNKMLAGLPGLVHGAWSCRVGTHVLWKIW